MKPSRLAPDQVAWGGGPDIAKQWIPEDFTPLSWAEIYGDLTDEQKLRYNQYYALKIAEEFIWLETYALIPPLEGLLRGDVPTPAFRTLLKSFIVDEENHSAAVWQLLRRARHDLYPTNEFVFIKPPFSVIWMVATAARFPRLLASWALFAGTMEEQTIPISRGYKEAGDSVDPLFANVFTLHALDEARHCKIDYQIAEWLIAPQRRLPKWVNGTVLGLLNQAYLDPGWGSDTPVRHLVADFPDLGERETEMIEATKRARSSHYLQHLLDRSLHPLTVRNAERYPMLDRALRRIAGSNGSS